MSQPKPQEIPQPPLSTYSLSTILSHAATHHIYKPLLINHPSYSTSQLTLQSFSYLHKDHLIKCFQELRDTDPTFLHSTYISPTGGTRSNATKHLYFFTSSAENRVQRALAATLFSTLKTIESSDIVINLHGALPMYRSQDLSGTLLDLCGATELSIGVNAEDADIAQIGRAFGANAITASSSRILQLARYVYSLRREGGEEKVGFKLKKVIFTSEPLSKAQEKFLNEALGTETVSSIYASAEAGPWVGTIPKRIAGDENTEETPGSVAPRSFVFDRRQIVVEVIDPDENVLDSSTNPPPEGRKPSVGELVLTSLTRLKNPLVRYRTGDFGSLHSFSSLAGTEEILKDKPEATEYLCGITMHGRDANTSFFLDSDYINTIELDRRVFAEPEWDIVYWQVILYYLTDEELKAARTARASADRNVNVSKEGVEFRVVRKSDQIPPVGYEERLERAIVNRVISEGIKLHVKVVGYDGLEKGKMARKVIKIVDRRL
ncbi:hypothetical protein L211DRAFT_834540 [Terfezia boudieri ATCC MYA-4762]|uniref:AMP-dependent synthetase/ligase domain-containing protein n=1 Tax=Terfezia boudieri ATCC MYA-4762 TaxID=1051890 RepID=A0A3N4M1E9_9PEZI|nr:hypothetical protein L211DRAFT_834540 [Terfezia boudieri ATCC MYA-4762]